MPNVYLDGSRIDFETQGGNATVGELMNAVEEGMKTTRRFVFELWIDGERMEEWRKSDFLEEPISRFTDLDLKTESVETLALEGVDMVQEYVSVIKENIVECVKGLRVGEDVEHLLTSIMEGIVEVVKTTDSLLKGVEKYEIALFKETPIIYYKPLLKYLETIVDAANTADSIALADILEYELSPFLEKIEKRIFFKADS